MIRKKFFSVKNDFRTGVLSRVFLALAFILFFCIVLIITIGILFANETNESIGLVVSLYHSSVIDILLAFLIITVGLGGILWFFKRQFVKLDTIANEYEEETNDQNEDEMN